MNSKNSSISLYVHIPFCSSKCSYCDFYKEDYGYHRISSVIDEIIKQLEFKFKEYNSPIIESVFIGGGTPSLIPIKDLERLLSSISICLSKTDIEWTIESNPETITKRFLE